MQMRRPLFVLASMGIIASAFAIGLIFASFNATAQEVQGDGGGGTVCNVQATTGAFSGDVNINRNLIIKDQDGDTVQIGEAGGGAGRFDFFMYGGAGADQRILFAGGDDKNGYYIDGVGLQAYQTSIGTDFLFKPAPGGPQAGYINTDASGKPIYIGLGVVTDVLNDVFTGGKLFVNRRFGDINAMPAIDLAIGDSDTGLNSADDGLLDFYANGNKVMSITPNGVTGIGIGGGQTLSTTSTNVVSGVTVSVAADCEQILGEVWEGPGSALVECPDSKPVMTGFESPTSQGEYASAICCSLSVTPATTSVINSASLSGGAGGGSQGGGSGAQCNAQGGFCEINRVCTQLGGTPSGQIDCATGTICCK